MTAIRRLRKTILTVTTIGLIFLIGLAFGESASVARAQESGRSAAPPNVLFLFADDMTYEALGSLRHTDIETPNLDRLAARGTTFTHAYNMGSWSGAVCIASRTMLLTGRYVWNANAVLSRLDAEREAGHLWPQLMADAGYYTCMTGKWHVDTDVKRCFEETRNLRPGMPRTVPESYNRPREGETDSWSPSDPSLGGFWDGGKHWSEVAADDAIAFLANAAEQAKPFMMYVAFNAPHDPRQSPQEYLDRYPLERLAIPDSYQDEYPFARAIGCGPDLRDEALAPFPRTRFAIRKHRQEYYALVTHLDEQIGRILDQLEASGKAENTLVIFTSDHGLAVGNHGLMGKQNLYEHSVRVPFLMAGPGVPVGKRIDAAIYLQDVVPTTLEIAGARQPEHIDFQSLWPLLRGQTQQSAYPAIYGGYLKLQRSITIEGWKLIVYPKAEVVRLYDLNRDPKELQDLASLPEHGERIDSLWDRLIELQTELNDDLDLKKLRQKY